MKTKINFKLDLNYIAIQNERICTDYVSAKSALIFYFTIP